MVVEVLVFEVQDGLLKLTGYCCAHGESPLPVSGNVCSQQLPLNIRDDGRGGYAEEGFGQAKVEPHGRQRSERQQAGAQGG